MTDPVSRRHFLGRLGAGAATVVAGGYAMSVWQASDRLAGASRLRAGDLAGSNGHTLIVIELAGGNDTLNTVVPHADSAYRGLRPTLAVEDPIDLDGSIGLHPSLQKLAARYKAGDVAIVEGLGYDNPDLSHFGSSAIWWTAKGGTGGGGWIGAYLDGTVGFDDPLAAIGIGPNPSPALLGRTSFATTIVDASGLEPQLPPWADDADELLAAWSHFSPAKVDASEIVGQVQRAIGLTGTARKELTRALDDFEPRDAGGDAYATRYDAQVGDSLELAAELVQSPARPRVIYVSGIGDFDTHEGQARGHPALLAQLDVGIERLFDSLGDAADRVVVMTSAEFGRRPAENGSGTDHGTAASHFVIGPKVKGGRYGRSPSLTELDQSANLVHTSDFRSLYATVLAGWLDADAKAVLGERFDTFSIFP